MDVDQTLEKTPHLGTGKSGIEFFHEKMLRGVPGRERIEVNARGRPIRVFQDVDSKPGRDLRLSINMSVQLFVAETLRQGNLERVSLGSSEVQKALAESSELRAHLAVGDDLILRDKKNRLVPPESGAAVVMDIKSGVVSLVSTPMFDPNLFTGHPTRDWQRLNGVRTPLLNRSFLGMRRVRHLKWWLGLLLLRQMLYRRKPTYSVQAAWSWVMQNFIVGERVVIIR